MIGIVVVSHSRALGESVVALAREMVGGEPPPVAVAAGLDETTFGTDAAAVSAAIEEVAGSADGVLVLVDIGSSVLSAEMACEFLDPDVVTRVRISAAPLVEGIVPAVVSAAGGADLDEVEHEAAEGLTAKREHLDAGRVPEERVGVPAKYSEERSGGATSRGGRSGGGVSRPADPGLDTQPRSSAATRPAGLSAEITLTDPHGLHARPAAKLVALVRRFDADVTVANLDRDGHPVAATSLSKVATLNAGCGARLRVTADGPQADDVLSAVRDLLTQEASDEVTGTPASSSAVGAGSAAVTRGSGLDAALGPAYVLQHDVNIDDYQSGSPEEERDRSDRAIEAVTQAIRRQQGNDPAVDDMLDAHLALLADDAVRDEVDKRMAAGDPAPHAWQGVLRDLAAAFEALDDAYQRARAQDVRTIERKLLICLVEGLEAFAAHADSVPDGTIVVIDELDPATAAALDARTVSGVVTVRGGDTGHGAIVARSRGIPIFTDGGEDAARITDGEMLGFDSSAGLLVVDPNARETERLRSLVAGRAADAAQARRRAAEPAITGDGVRIRVGVNITSTHDALGAGAAGGAEGSGLVRTELVFGKERAAPRATQQAGTFLSIAGALHWQPITIRTWDVGGDKPLPFLPGPHEANPMLGLRGLRLTRQRPEIFDEQLRAVCIASEQTPVRLMFPMVTTREEVDWALERLTAARADVGFGPVAVGIMVEVPAAALRIADLAVGLDFVSIGTNDLTQYVTAADRGNTGVGDIADGLDPAVLQLIRHVAGHVADDVEVAVCGDLASRPEVVPLLVGLGVQELSVTGPVVARVKQAVRHTDLEAARELADRALAAPSAASVRELLVPPR